MSLTSVEAAATLRAREAAETLERERRAAAARSALRAALAEFLRPGERAWLIGSLAWGGFGQRSDVDLVVDAIPADRMVELERLVARATGAPAELLELVALPTGFRERVEREGLAFP